MINNRRLFLKGMAGVFIGTSLPKTGYVNANRVLLVDGKEVCKYLSAIIQPDRIHVRLQDGDEGWESILAIESLFRGTRRKKSAIELHNNGNARRWLGAWLGSSCTPRTDAGMEHNISFWTDYEEMI